VSEREMYTHNGYVYIDIYKWKRQISFARFTKKKNVKKYKMVDITFCYNCSLAAFYFHYFAYIYIYYNYPPIHGVKMERIGEL